MLTKTAHTDFPTHVLTSAVDGPHVLIIAGIHGDELEPMLAAMNFVKRCQNKLRKGKVTVVPVANISAFEGKNRCGADNLDLARTLPGSKKGSLTLRLAHSISELIKTADYLIDLHTGGALFDILPLCGYLLHPEKKIRRQQQNMARAFNLPLIWGTDSAVNGRTLSAARDYGIPAIYAESRGGLIVNQRTIASYEQGCINVLQHLGLFGPYIRKKELLFTWLEDYRPGQGHLQVKLPSPQAGVFVPAVSLGEKVKKGSLIGYVVDPVSDQKTQIFSSEEGTVFMLRISARVGTGDSLGGILPILKKGKKIIYAK